MTSSARGSYDQVFEDLSHVYLEDSWVLHVDASENSLQFSIEAVLTPEHGEYGPPRVGEQYCYRRAVLTVSSPVPIEFVRSDASPARDATDEFDYGNIDTFEQVEVDGDAPWELTGLWGAASVRRPVVTLTLLP